MTIGTGIGDFEVMQTAQAGERSDRLGFASVPIPAGVWLFVSSLIALGVVGRRRQLFV